jgi:hypothetical protein
LGLAAALLGELSFGHRLVVWAGQVETRDGPPLPDALTRAVLEQIAAEPEHRALRVRLEGLSSTAYELVAHRLWQSGAVRQEVSGRRLFGRSTVSWIPTDMNSAAWSYMRLITALKRGEQLNHFDGFLVGLAVSTGLSALLLDGTSPTVAAYVDRLPSSIHPSLGELLAHTTAALGNSVLTYRT